MYDHELGFRERMAKPWSPSSGTELALDILTLGATRRRREGNIRAHYAYLDSCKLSQDAGAQVVAPRLLSNVRPGAKKIAQLALRVASTAQAVHVETYQGYRATLTRDADGRRRASSSFVGSLHEPTLYRVREATGRDYTQDLRDVGALAVLRTSGSYVDIEGLGCMANEYSGRETRTGRVTDVAFLIRGVSSTIAEQFVDALRVRPTETIDSIVYTAFADITPPGRSLLQIPPANQRTDSLLVPGVCNAVVAATIPKRF